MDDESRTVAVTITLSTWPGGKGAAVEENFLIGTTTNQGSSADQLDRLISAYRNTLAQRQIPEETGVTATFFVPDASAWDAVVRAHPLVSRMGENGMAVTVIQQPPSEGGIGLLAYHVSWPEADVQRHSFQPAGFGPHARGLTVARGRYRFHYLKDLTSTEIGAGEQIKALLEKTAESGIGLGSVMRTWKYVRDLDHDYPSLSAARNRVFDRHGLVRGRGGFPAATAIEGCTADPSVQVVLDLWAVTGLTPGQTRPLSARLHMNDAADYGANFERGREIVFGDRRHLHVSGTASVDNTGAIVHPGDVRAQTEKVTANVIALLGNANSGPAALRYVLVYVRNPGDAEAVAETLALGPLKNVPKIILEAKVCRPGWLVEIEGFAIDRRGDPQHAPF